MAIRGAAKGPLGRLRRNAVSGGATANAPPSIVELWKEFVKRRWNAEAKFLNLEVRCSGLLWCVTSISLNDSVWPKMNTCSGTRCGCPIAWRKRFPLCSNWHPYCFQRYVVHGMLSTRFHSRRIGTNNLISTQQFYLRKGALAHIALPTRSGQSLAAGE